MSTPFKAFRIHEENKKIVARFERLNLDDLAAKLDSSATPGS